jgi:hypothetical protein
MKFSLGLGLGLSLVVGCADAPIDEDDCMPGDIDCAPKSSDGKADGFDFRNDPLRMSQNLNYRIAELPRKGARTNPLWKTEYPDAVGRAEVAWADTYWPTLEGGHNTRYQGRSIKSPIEKYDAAFNNAAGCADQPARTHGAGAKAAHDTYFQCAGPATKWQVQNYQNARVMFDGIDNDGDGKVDELNADGDVDGAVASWWGTCHAWAPASIMMPEPQQDVTINGVTFQPGDIKAMIQNAWDQTSAVMLGGRCNSKEVKHGPDISANEACADLNPGAMHVVLANFIGIANLALVEDRTANFEIWNQAVMGYEVLRQEAITPADAMACVGATGNTWTYNTRAVELLELEVKVDYLTESFAQARPVGARNHIRSDFFHYILEIGSTGKIIGGRYCTNSGAEHVDFLWSPTGQFAPTNPFISVAKVKELVAKSVAKTGGGGGPGKVFKATPNLAIPDNAPAGVSADVQVTDVTGSPALAVTVDITHTWRGDLVVELLREGQLVKRLHDRSGGSADNLQQTFTLSAAEVGTANGRWTVRVVDTASADVGTLKSFELGFN